MNKTAELPKLNKKKTIDHKKLMSLAKKVRQSLKEEEKYLEEKSKHDENSIAGRFFLNS